MWIHGKDMIGEVVEKKRARQIYQSYKRQRKDPGLPEQVSYKQFEMRIFPIPAGAEQKVKVTSDRPLNVVILSDGITQPQEHRELLELIGQRPAGVRLFSIGMGNEVDRPLLRQLSKEAGRLAAFLSDSDNYERQAKAFQRKLLRPAMNQVRLNLVGVETYDLEPRKLPNLYYGSPVRVYGRYRGSGPMTVKIEAEVLGQSLQVKMPDLDESNPEIERTWAWHRVQRLLAEQRRSSQTGNQQEEIVRLCEDYSIVSEYTSPWLPVLRRSHWRTRSAHLSGSGWRFPSTKTVLKKCRQFGQGECFDAVGDRITVWRAADDGRHGTWFHLSTHQGELPRPIGVFAPLGVSQAEMAGAVQQKVGLLGAVPPEGKMPRCGNCLEQPLEFPANHRLPKRAGKWRVQQIIAADDPQQKRTQTRIPEMEFGSLHQ